MRLGARVFRIWLLALFLFPLLSYQATCTRAREIQLRGFSSYAPDNSWELRAETGTSYDGKTYHLSSITFKLRNPIGENTILVVIASKGELEEGELWLLGPVKLFIYERFRGYKYTRAEGELSNFRFSFSEKLMRGERALIKEYTREGRLIRISKGEVVEMDFKSGSMRLMRGFTLSTLDNLG